MAIVILPAALRQFTENQTSIELQCGKVLSVFESLWIKYPSLKPVLFEKNQLSNYIKLFLNGQEISDQNVQEIELSPQDTLTIVTAIAGG